MLELRNKKTKSENRHSDSLNSQVATFIGVDGGKAILIHIPDYDALIQQNTKINNPLHMRMKIAGAAREKYYSSKNVLSDIYLTHEEINNTHLDAYPDMERNIVIFSLIDNNHLTYFGIAFHILSNTLLTNSTTETDAMKSFYNQKRCILQITQAALNKSLPRKSSRRNIGYLLHTMNPLEQECNLSKNLSIFEINPLIGLLSDRLERCNGRF